MSIEEILRYSILEDIGYGDITTDNLNLSSKTIKAKMIAKHNGILAGVFLLKKIFDIIDKEVKIGILKNDGEELKKGDIIAILDGNASSILKAERVSLNFIQRLSGIASYTKKFVEKAKKYNVKILDTRKTTPLLRELEKYAVRVGGGYNHRFGLFDMILIKENHIRSAGSITKAVEKIRENDVVHKIEVEVTNLEELKEVVSLKVDRALLDNMTLSDLKKAVSLYKGTIELEASGNVTLETVEEIASTGVDYISTGSITHSFKSLDISLLFGS